MKFIGGLLTAGTIMLGLDGVDLVKVFTQGNGRIGVQNQVDGNTTAFDIFPSLKNPPEKGPVSQVTLYRSWHPPFDFERISIQAMGNRTPVTDDRAYRIQVDRLGAGEYLPIEFCFGQYANGRRRCPLKITPNAVYISRSGGEWVEL